MAPPPVSSLISPAPATTASEILLSFGFVPKAGLTDWLIQRSRQRMRLISLHFDTPYGVAAPAFDTVAAMPDYWAPEVNR